MDVPCYCGSHGYLDPPFPSRFVGLPVWIVNLRGENQKEYMITEGC